MIINQTFGASGETASIVVTAPTGSTVTCTTPSGIVLTATEISGTWTFARLKVYGTYVVTATNGTKTATENVLVDAAEQFEVEMIYGLKLYWDGDECTALTGGWNKFSCYIEDSAHDGIQYMTLTKNSDNMTQVFTSSGIGGVWNGCIGTTNKINVTGYNTLKVEYKVISAGSHTFQDLDVYASSRHQNENGTYYRIVSSGNPSSTDTVTATKNISAKTGEQYIYFVQAITDRDTTGINVRYNKVWLE